MGKGPGVGGAAGLRHCPNQNLKKTTDFLVMMISNFYTICSSAEIRKSADD